MLEIILVSGMVVTDLALVVLQIIKWRYKKMNQKTAMKLLEWSQSLTKEQQERIYSLALKVTDNNFFGGTENEKNFGYIYNGSDC